ncbi:uncharacterized protein LOC131639452 [Vicia villosa]|uniref:uncharacterized protein LOC131639452 n=1 Tax=Vicia villosa TaxID=3911 RepID=UPI00273AFCCA|nr:uncharacterized protein LOC131639452 [Vicia villosa]
MNIRGGGSLIKRKSISNIIIQGKADIFLIQELKLKEVGIEVAGSLWQKESIGWSFSASEGRSGGLITLWKEYFMSAILSFRGIGYLGTKLNWKGSTIYIVNIYSPCSIQGRKDLWKEIIGLRDKFSNGEWLVGGDFNSTKNRSERKGCIVARNSERRLFSSFIEDSLLIDLPCLGNCFSWFSGDGFSMSRLDRFLVDESLVDRLGLDFLPFVEKEWRKMKIEGRGDYVLKEKIRLLKASPRRWNEDVFGRFDLLIEDGVKRINVPDDLLKSCKEDEVDGLVKVRSEVSRKMWLNMRVKENMLLQKSRARWDREGDMNNKYFHSVLKSRRRRNFIGRITTERGKVEKVEKVKEEIRRHFEAKFEEANSMHPWLEGIQFKSISSADKCALLKRVLVSIISESHSAFVPGRNLLDGNCDINILQFDDNTLLVGNGNWQQVWALKTVLRANFLNCNIENMPFHFLGFHIGANHNSVKWWEPLLQKLRAGLSRWKGRMLSLGGRITMVRTVLSSLSIFQLSFFKAPSSVYKEIEKVQNNFLWGNIDGKRKINWFRWDSLCLPKENGGLGFKSLKEFNAALLFKWSWQILRGSNALSVGVRQKAQSSSEKGDFVDSMGTWSSSGWGWGNFGIDPTIQVMQQELLLLRNLLQNVKPSLCESDSIVWMQDKQDGYTTRSGYKELFGLRQFPTVSALIKESLQEVWKSKVPFRTKAFGWRCIMDRSPSKMALVYRGVNVNISCVLCTEEGGDLFHLFFGCGFINLVWQEVSSWLGMQ